MDADAKAQAINFNIHDILKVLPHRYPFLLVDRILEVDAETGKVVGLKNVTMNEPFFQGHFPEFPTMPGVLILEAMAQVGAVGLLSQEKTRKILFLVGVDKARFREPVQPGDQLIITVEFLNKRENFGKVKAVAAVSGKKVAECELLYALQERK